MNESKLNISKVLIFTVGIIGVIILLFYIISSKALPSFREFMANSTTTPALIDSSEINESLNETYYTNIIHAPNGDIQVEISDTVEEMELGLSGRASLDSNSGMLFIFPDLGPQSFWMKDMLFSLDIVWINANKEVVGIIPNLSPDSYPEAFSSPEEVQYVLELNAGVADRFGITMGTSLKF